MANEDSSAEGSSAWKGWVLAIVAAPVVYVLSVPPLILVAVCDRKTGTFRSDPAWLSWYAAPGDWLFDNVTLVKEPLDAYFDWCFKMYTGQERS